MNCPVCGERMREIEKHGVHLDICPGCKGIWLDRGELEKIIDQAGGVEPEAPPAAESHPAPEAPWPVGPNFEPARPREEPPPPPQPQSEQPATPRYEQPRPPYEPPRPQYEPPYHKRRRDDDDDDDDDDRYRPWPGERGRYEQHGHYGTHERYHGKPYKRKHWLSEILESFGD